MLFLYTHRMMALSTLTREASLCSGQWLTQNFTTGQRAEKRLWGPQPQLQHLYHLYSAKGVGNVKEEGQR